MQFSVAGMSTTNSHNSSTWTPSGGVNNGLGDNFIPARSTYQSGYMMSTSQMDTSSQGPQRMDEVPIVETKAKMNQRLARSATSDFGMESMFKSSRRKSAMIDEDAPPTNSVNDIPTESYSNESRSARQPLSRSIYETPKPAVPASQPSNHYIIVYGYPPDKYSVTVEYFQSLGASVNAEPHDNISNAFRIGFSDPGAAMRAVRKSGDILGGSYMIGVKWADDYREPQANTAGASEIQPSTPANTSSHAPPPTVGTPIRLAPSTAAFRKPGSTPVSSPIQKAAPQSQQLVQSNTSTPQKSPEKGVVAQMSDMIFGW